MRIPGKHATANSTYGGIDFSPPSHIIEGIVRHVLFSRVRSLLGWGETGRLEDWRCSREWGNKSRQQWVKVFCFRLLLSLGERVFIFYCYTNIPSMTRN